MYFADLGSVRAVGRPLESQNEVEPPGWRVHDERKWRTLPDGVVASPAARVIASRWQAGEEGQGAVSAEGAAGLHLVAIALRRTKATLIVSGRTVHDGIMMPGMVHVTPPGIPVRGIFRGPCDMLHLHVLDAAVAACVGRFQGGPAPDLSDLVVPLHDATAEQFGRVLLAAEQGGGSLGSLYADSICMAIVARLLTVAQGIGALRRPRVAPLPKWRLKRAIDHIEANLAEPVRLVDVASSAGLSRMHFAAQFRAATGLRPHDYLQRRRIERAQQMLLDTRMSPAEIALAVGFQTQSHFTCVFKQFVGQPPFAWHRLQVQAQALP